jgi:hypothetical protein
LDAIKPLERNLLVKAEPSVRTAETDGAKILCVRIDPVALDTESRRERGSVDQPPWATCLNKQLCDASGDRLDQLSIDCHIPYSAEMRPLPLRQHHQGKAIRGFARVNAGVAAVAL